MIGRPFLPFPSPLEEAFRRFDAENPEIYRLMCHFCDMALRAGRVRYSVNAIFERIRWHVEIDTRSEDPWKLNNNHRAFYARKWLAEHPETPRFFETREQRPVL